MENKTFRYSYSATQNKEVESIRNRYLPKEENKLEILKKLDSRVQSAGMIESLCLGIVGALVFGVGMCFGLDALKGADFLAFLFGIAGTAMMLPAYPLYKRISKKTKARFSPEILRLSEEIMQA